MEKLAEELGICVKGVDSIRKNRWGADDKMDFENEVCFRRSAPRPSNYIGAKKTEESVELKIGWILE